MQTNTMKRLGDRDYEKKRLETQKDKEFREKTIGELDLSKEEVEWLIR